MLAEWLKNIVVCSILFLSLYIAPIEDAQMSRRLGFVMMIS
ncbi:MAG: hypothetical protein ACLTDF_08070 [Coprococcus sp.]